MKILFNCNNTAFQSKGGGEVLLLKTKEYLEKGNIKIKFFDQWQDKIEDYGILHNFGLSANCYDLINLSYNKNIPIVVTPIYSWPSIRFAIRSGFTLDHKLKLGIYAFFHNTNFINNLTAVKKILNKANKILPDSKIEADLLSKTFKINKNKFYPVPCGVDSRFYKTSKKEFVDKYGLEDFVLYVGRIDPRKNVLKLIRIMNKLKFPLVIIGRNLPHEKEYYDMCKKLAKNNIHFLGWIDHESSLLESAYAAAKVVVLPTFLETPGLSTLEGGLAGANIVVTSRGSAREYYKDYAHYVNPFNEKDIKDGIARAYKEEKNINLREHIRKNFLWNNVVKKVKQVYNTL